MKILKGVKYFSSVLLQNYLVFITGNKYFEFLVAPNKFINENPKKFQKKVLKILLDRIILLLQVWLMIKIEEYLSYWWSLETRIRWYAIRAEAKDCINFTESEKGLC